MKPFARMLLLSLAAEVHAEVMLSDQGGTQRDLPVPNGASLSPPSDAARSPEGPGEPVGGVGRSGSGVLSAATAGPTELTVAPFPSAATQSTPRATPYYPKDTRRHDEFVKIARAGGVDVVFFGDSITDFWGRPANKLVWDKYFAPLKAANFGIAGDGTQGVLWRLQNGELDGIRPKLVVLLIGTNNIGQKPETIAAGIKDIIDEIQQRSPGTRILLHGIFPRGPHPGGSAPRIVQLNEMLATFAQPKDPKRVIFIDIGAKFLNPDRTVNKELTPDTLHLSRKGYEVWADAIIDTVTKELR